MMKRAAANTPYAAYLVLCIVLCLNIVFWLKTRTLSLEWNNVPPVPSSAAKAGLPGLGDDQAAYRMYGYTLQNLGNTGG
ncbi:MAG: hypothetical protein DI626_09905, partial [Micavibrio aeruginosavorus]